MLPNDRIPLFHNQIPVNQQNTFTRPPPEFNNQYFNQNQINQNIQHSSHQSNYRVAEHTHFQQSHHPHIDDNISRNVFQKPMMTGFESLEALGRNIRPES